MFVSLRHKNQYLFLRCRLCPFPVETVSLFSSDPCGNSISLSAASNFIEKITYISLCLFGVFFFYIFDFNKIHFKLGSHQCEVSKKKCQVYLQTCVNGLVPDQTVMLDDFKSWTSTMTFDLLGPKCIFHLNCQQKLH